jgi:chromosomal replication initiation ATPase DnaA
MKAMFTNIIAVVEEVFDCPGKLATRTKDRTVADARVVYSVLAKKYVKKSTSSMIGSHINRDHSTVLHHFKKHEDLFTIKDKDYTERFETCDALVKGFTDVKPVDFKELLQEKVQELSQMKCKALLTIIEN